MSDLSFPIGPFVPPTAHDAATRSGWISELERLPGQVAACVEGLDDPQLDTPYRPGGWTVRQLVHHIPDSHLNAYVRFKLALSEDEPVIRPYDQDGWAALPDSRGSIDAPLALLAALHARWVALLRTLDEDDWNRRLVHPESGTMSLATVAALYSWHGRHHLAHLEGIRRRRGW